MLDELAYRLSNEPSPPLLTGDDYRELAGAIRGLPARTRLPVARRELLRVASNYERRGDHLDRRSYYKHIKSVAADVQGYPDAHRPAAGAAGSSVRGAGIECDRQQRQRCASTKAKQRVPTQREGSACVCPHG